MSKYTAKPKYAAKPPTYKDDLTAYYNDVEEAIIVVFGTFEKAAEWFDKHATALNSLFAYCEELYITGWSASRAANEWYHLNVAALPVVKNPTAPAKTYTYVSYKSAPEIEPEVLAARAARAAIWENAYLST